MATNQVFESVNQSRNFKLLNVPANQHAAVIDDYIVEELSSVLYLSPDDLFSHDSHINNDATFELSVQNAKHGDVYWDGNQVVFIPEAGYSGQACFEYTVMDRQGCTDSATVHLTIWQVQE